MLLAIAIAAGGVLMAIPWGEEPGDDTAVKTPEGTTTAPEPTTEYAPTATTVGDGGDTVTTTVPNISTASVELPSRVHDGVIEVEIEVKNTGSSGEWSNKIRTYRDGYPERYNNVKNVSIEIEPNENRSKVVVFEVTATGEWPVLIDGKQVGTVDVISLSANTGAAGASMIPDPSINVTVDTGANAQ